MPRLDPKPTVKQPGLYALQLGEMRSKNKTTDGCHVEEADGHCPHGHPTWMLYLGFI